MAVRIGLTSDQSKEVANELAVLLSNTYILYLKTQSFHWNVESQQFYALHLMFEEQYKDLGNAADEIAERIRSLGMPAPGSFKQFSELAAIAETTTNPSDEMMINQLLEDHETICQNIRTSLKKVQDTGDEGSADLIIDRLKMHEKTAWMLRSIRNI